MNLSILLAFISTINFADDKLTGNWTPLYYKAANQLICHSRLSDSPSIISFNNGKMKIHHCNNYSFHYSVVGKTLVVKGTVAGIYTEIACFGGLLDKIEGELKESETNFWMNDDTLVLFLKGGGKIKLVRTNKFDFSWYDELYKKTGCKWSVPKICLKKDSINNEPIYRCIEKKATLIDDCDPQEFVDDALAHSNIVNQRGVKIQGEVLITIDTSGNLYSYKMDFSLRHEYNDEVINILNQMNKWKPAEVNDKPVNSEQKLVFTF
ncbi:MAG: hypothetical protein OCD76_06780 [Reichenbachiella sp.]